MTNNNNSDFPSRDLKFLSYSNEDFSNYPVKLIQGFLDSFTKGKLIFPEIENCLASDYHVQESLEMIIKAVEGFKGTDRNIQNFIYILIDLCNVIYRTKIKFDSCFKDTSKEISIIKNKIEEFFMNLPPNFKIYHNNYKIKKNEIKNILVECKDLIMKDPYKLGFNLATIFEIILKDADFADEGLESYEEFELFNHCYANLLVGIETDLFSLNSIIKFIYKKESLENLFQNLATLFEVLSDQIEYCNKYNKHLKIK